MLDEYLRLPTESENLDLPSLEDKFRLVAFGDSITEVTALERPQRWTGILEASLGGRAAVVNAGIGGTSSTLGLFRWKRDVAPVKPHCLVVNFLLNDSHVRHYECPSSYVVQCTPDQMVSNLTTIVERAADLGAATVFWSPPPVPPFRDAFQSTNHMEIQIHLIEHYLWHLERLAAELQVPLANFWRTFPTLVEEFPGPYFTPPDGYHTTAAAQPILAKAIAEAVRPIYHAWEKTHPTR